MLNLKTPLLDITNQAYETAQEVLPHADIITSASEIRTHLADYQPVMMFYGTYNSGKSTLLNAILGDDVAETADKPCTMRIDKYTFGDYTIYDTPGIDAPVEHERMSREQLQRCHVIAFVISTSGGFDEKETAKEIAAVFQSGKPIVLVLNNKSGFEMDSEELKSVLSKFLDNCTQVTGDDNLSKKVRIRIVNAKTGLKARSSNKQSLYEISGVAALERELLDVLQKTSGNNLLTVAVELLDNALTDLQNGLTQTLDDQALTHHQELVQQIKKVRANFEEQVIVDIRGLRSGLIGEIVTALRNNEDFTGALKRYIIRIETAFDNRAKQTLKDLERDIQALSEKFTHSLDVSPSPQCVPAEIVDDDASPTTRIIEKQSKEIIRKVAFNEQQTQEAIKQGMLFLRKMKTPLFKGRWERTLTRWAGHGAKALTAVVYVAVFAYDIYKANKAQQRYEQQQREREETIQREARNMAEDCEREIVSQVSAIAAEFFTPVQSEYENHFLRMSESSERSKDNLKKIGIWQAQLQEIRTQISE